MKSNELMDYTAYEGRVSSELSADFILPDTYPDVKRVLRVDAKPVLIGRYISGRRLEFTGAVDYTVIFCADGEAGETLHCVHFAQDFDGGVGDAEALEGANITLKPRMTACSQRLANPRKLTLKSTVGTDVRISAALPCTPACEGATSRAEEMGLEKLTRSIPTRRERTFLADPLRISEDLEPDASQPAIDEIISCSADVCFHEAKINRDGDFTVSLKGEALINTIYKSQGEAGVYKSFSRKCPVAYIVGADEYEEHFKGCRPETLCARADATTVEINASVGENGFGERRVAQVDVTADVSVCIMGTEDIQIVLDAYSPLRASECSWGEATCEDVGKVLFANFSVGESVSRDGLSIPENATVLDTAANATASAITLERGRGQLTGSADVSCIFAADGEYGCVNVSVPIKCELNVGDMSEPIAHTCDMSVSDMRVRLDNERVYFDFEVSLCAQVCEKKRHRFVSAIRLTGEAAKPCSDCAITLCYPSPDDTLWSVAKRYSTTVSALEAANSAGSRVLLIPRAPVGMII